MDISEFALRLLLIFFPGIISASVIDLLTSNRKRELKSFFLSAFILGLTSYFIHYILIQLINLLPRFNYEVYFLDYLLDSGRDIVWVEVIWATITSFLFGLFVTVAINRRWMHRIAIKFKITNKFAEEDVWGFVFNSKDAKWVLVRDYNNKLMYEGWVEAFSETHKDDELLLRDVKVYNLDSMIFYMRLKGSIFRKEQKTLCWNSALCRER